MAMSRKARRGKMSRRSRGKKSTRRARKQKQRGGGDYVLTFAGVPAVGSPAPAGLGDLGTYTAGNQSFTIATTKTIKDIRLLKADGVTEYNHLPFAKLLKIEVGGKKNIIPSTVSNQIGPGGIRGGIKLTETSPSLSGPIKFTGVSGSALAILGGGGGFAVKVITA